MSYRWLQKINRSHTNATHMKIMLYDLICNSLVAQSCCCSDAYKPPGLFFEHILITEASTEPKVKVKVKVHIILRASS